MSGPALVPVHYRPTGPDATAHLRGRLADLHQAGAVSAVRLFGRLVRGGAPTGTLGVAAAPVGGGLGVAGLFEVVR